MVGLHTNNKDSMTDGGLIGYLSVFIILSIKTVMPGAVNLTDLKEQNNFDSLKQWNRCHT
jgi:hypothetical protein